MEVDQKSPADPCERWWSKVRLPLPAFAGLVLTALAIYSAGDAAFSPAPVSEHPGFIDTLLGSRAVVAAIRLAVIFAGAFVVASVVALIARGQWLTRVGPVEVSERVSDLELENRLLEESLENAEQTIDVLRYKLGETNFLLGRSVGGETEPDECARDREADPKE
jgi:hypothetical protein